MLSRDDSQGAGRLSVEAARLPLSGVLARHAAEIICLKSVAWRGGDAADFIAN
jgi:hypothetical protein